MDKLTLQDFKFTVPEAQIAQMPMAQRHDSKLLIWNGHQISQSFIKNLADIIPPKTLIILNNSRVIASRLMGNLSTGGKIELFLLEPVGPEGEGFTSPSKTSIPNIWLALGKPMRKLQPGVKVYFPQGLVATVVPVTTLTHEQTDMAGHRSVHHPHVGVEPITVEFNIARDELPAWLDRHGHIPLPPYIHRKLTQDDHANAVLHDVDRTRYQTIYAEGNGSVAAPTAGLHLSQSVFDALKANQCEFANVTLHIGAGTFLPVKSQDPSEHVMHSERFLVPKSTLILIAKAKMEHRKILVVGTTALRSLEGLQNLANKKSCTRDDLADQWLRTDIFIRPEKKFDRFHSWFADGILTNFHQPESTLYMLICALVGYTEAQSIYQYAIQNEFRFFSYGDSSLLWFKNTKI